MTRKLTYALVWFSLTQEVDGFIFDGVFRTWLTDVGSFLFKGLPIIHVIPWDALVMGALLASPIPSKRKRVVELGNAAKVCFMGLAISWFWGVARGGSAYQTMFQIRTFIMHVFLGLLITAVITKKSHVRALGWVIVSAAIYRSGVLFTFWYLVTRHYSFQVNVITDHADSVLFVTALFITILNAVERRTPETIFFAVCMFAVMMTAMVLNNRRIAWLDMGVAGAFLYLLWPAGKVKRFMTRGLIVASPFLAAYMAIGWGHPTGIFKPVGSVSSMFGEHQDPSSIMRDIENYNLMRTLKQNPILGWGWGHEYIEEVVAYSIADIFPQYRFLPHNSLLGMVAFSGMIGFAMIWQIMAVSIFLQARVCLF
ncbi:MAG TPA: O-antigen ligase family protein, partial [Polyangiales bacterium]|nr:O-antigen ligase family protein [Polyangiales bacterium]